jgi:homocysteine S-methyltransferase
MKLQRKIKWFHCTASLLVRRADFGDHPPAKNAGGHAMSKYRNALPQMNGGMFLTDGGLETTMIFHEGHDLPCFSAMELLKTAAGRGALDAYFERYVPLAQAAGAGFIFESPTWRSSPDWGAALGYDPAALAAANVRAIATMEAQRARYESPETPCVISGCIGPRGDGYSPDTLMDAGEAEAYHAVQIGIFADTAADMVTGMTMTHPGEAAGIARAARAAGMPAALSFTVETDGRLPDGTALGAAIELVDDEAGDAVAYYMINCAHPTHFADALALDAPWVRRIRGLRANASRMSHAELDNAERLDEGNPVELGGEYRDLLARMPWINVLGGCCGTDHRHVAAIADACVRVPATAR